MARKGEMLIQCCTFQNVLYRLKMLKGILYYLNELFVNEEEVIAIDDQLPCLKSTMRRYDEGNLIKEDYFCGVLCFFLILNLINFQGRCSVNCLGMHLFY